MRANSIRVPPRSSAALFLPLLLATACRQDMHDQPKYKPLAESNFFADQRASRPVLAGTIARGQLREDTRLYTGKEVRADPITTFPTCRSRARSSIEAGRAVQRSTARPVDDRPGKFLAPASA